MVFNKRSSEQVTTFPEDVGFWEYWKCETPGFTSAKNGTSSLGKEKMPRKDPAISISNCRPKRHGLFSSSSTFSVYKFINGEHNIITEVHYKTA